MRAADIVFREKLLNREIAAQAKGRRAEHRHQVRKTAGGGEHFLGLGEVHRHPGLAENVFAGLER